MKICCVIPSVRPEQMVEFRKSWSRLFAYHQVAVVVVLDGDVPQLELNGELLGPAEQFVDETDRDLFFNKSDCVRNYGFYYAARYLDPDVVYTLDDDCLVLPGTDPISEHLSVLNKKVPLSWMNTGLAEPLYRGFPYAVRSEGKVTVSHGPWCDVPDLDAPTQLLLTGNINPDPEFFRGPIPRGVLAPICGMNLMCTRESLPLFYFAPMGPKVNLHRYSDIWLGISLLRSLWERNQTIYTGVGKIRHSRASDVFKNLAAEAEATRLNERYWIEGDGVHEYFSLYRDCRERYKKRIEQYLN